MYKVRERYSGLHRSKVHSTIITSMWQQKRYFDTLEISL